MSALKLKVVRADGRHEILSLAGTVTLHPATDGGMSSIQTSFGSSYFFLSDGSYDGWGAAVDGLSQDVAAAFIAAVEADREIE